jgi:hypothetical protein
MTADSSLIFAAAGAALGLLGLLLALAALRAARLLHERSVGVEASLASVRRELERIASASIKIERRLKRFEQETSDSAERLAQIELRGAGQCIDQAIDYARRGADPAKLSQHFGLSRGEADLVTRLHGRRMSA